MIKNNEAVSQVIGGFLMIMVAVASASVLYIYAPGEAYRMFGDHAPLCDLVGSQTADSFYIAHTGGNELEEVEVYANGTLVYRGENFSMGSKIELPLDHTTEVVMTSGGHLMFNAVFSPYSDITPEPPVPTEPYFPSGDYVNNTELIYDGYMGSDLVRHDTVNKGEITQPSDYGRCAFFVFQLPYMPSNATITDFSFHWCGEGYESSGLGYVEGHPLVCDVINATNPVLWQDCKDGASYFQVDKSDFIGGWHECTWSHGDWLGYDPRLELLECAHNGTYWSLGLDAVGHGWVQFSCMEQPSLSAYIRISFTVP